MTYDEWLATLLPFEAKALTRREIFQAGAASRDAEVAKLQSDLETERMRLAACGVAALGYFDGCKDEYRSASLDDVLQLFEKNNQLRAQINVLLEVLDKAGKHVRPTCFDLYDEIAATLSSTPEQSLAKYRNKVIEAFVNEFSRHVGGDGEFWLHELQDFAMKEQP